jgi:medium-chain acyl-[acyl-carrier-protein] hydrolase
MVGFGEALTADRSRPARELRVIRRSPNAKVRLFCFPYAGAGPSVFNEWKSLLPESVDLVGIVYPGRECRTAEPPARTLGELIEPLRAALQPYTDIPYAFFGHSMGAYVSFELARRLSRSGNSPAHLFLSAAGAPHIAEPNLIHHLAPADFLRQLIRLNGFPREVFRDPQLLSYALPILRADFTACETYRFEADAPCQSPMTVFGGDNDTRVDRHRLEAWRQLAGVSFAIRTFDGDHFYLREHRQALLGCVVRELNALS